MLNEPIVLEELKMAASTCMATAGCDDQCHCGDRVAFTAWLRATGRLWDGSRELLTPIARALSDLQADATAAFGHAGADCAWARPLPNWRHHPKCALTKSA